MPKWKWVITQLARRLWVRSSLIGALGVLAAILAAYVERYIPWTVPGSIAAGAVGSLLTIIASSMLAVTTFSLNIMVSAYGSATSNVTPRATKLLIEDRLTHRVLATFLGSFLFSIVGLIVLQMGAYGERGRVVLFAMTIAVIVMVVVALLRWIDQLTRFGRVGETTDRVEEAARQAIEARLREPCLGGQAWDGAHARGPSAVHAVVPDAIGYVQHIDMPALSRLCTANDLDIFVNAVPGTFVYPHTPLVWIGGLERVAASDTLRPSVLGAFSIGDERVFDQDPRFGLAVLAEIGVRALPPAASDSGTAIDVIGRMTRLLSIWAAGAGELKVEGPAHPRVHVSPLAPQDLFEDGFMLMARNGAGLIEVQMRLQKALYALSHLGDGAFKLAAARQSIMALDRAFSALSLDADRERLRELIRCQRESARA